MVPLNNSEQSPKSEQVDFEVAAAIETAADLQRLTKHFWDHEQARSASSPLPMAAAGVLLPETADEVRDFSPSSAFLSPEMEGCA